MKPKNGGGAPMIQLALLPEVEPRSVVSIRARRAGYPRSWLALAHRCKRKAGWKCEHCGHAHDPASGHVLTVHHLDGNPANCKWTNLVALCQRCHLHVQATWKPGGVIPAGWDGVPEWITRRGLAYRLVSEQRSFEDELPA